jgi:SAM-dependent methyltransferase
MFPSAEEKSIDFDPSSRMVEIARQLLPEVTFYLGGAESLPLPDASVDLVVSTVSFHHWRDKLVGLREVARVLRPGGSVLLADVSPLTWPSLWLLRHPRSQTPAEMRALFRKAGLRLLFQRFVVGGSVLVAAGQRD